MKNRMILLVFVLILDLISLNAFAGSVTLDWDDNEPTPDGTRIFQRVEGANYDYTAPVYEGLTHPVTLDLADPPSAGVPRPAIMSGSYDKATSEIFLSWDQAGVAAPNSLTYYFVARAFVGDEESGDSNEVSLDVTGANLSVAYWKIFYSLTSGGPYTELETVQNDGQTSITSPLTVLPSGVKMDVFFVVVAFADASNFSANSEELTVSVFTPPGLRKKVTVPVE